MITSLFKIVGLSLLSLCPFHKLADSSVSYELTANEVEKVSFKSEKRNAFHTSYLTPSYSDYVGFVGVPSNYVSAFNGFDGTVILKGEFKIAQSNIQGSFDDFSSVVYDRMVFMPSDGNNRLFCVFEDSNRVLDNYLMISGGIPYYRNYLITQCFHMKGNIEIDNDSNFTDSQFFKAFYSAFTSSYEVFNFSNDINFNAMYNESQYTPLIGDSTNESWNLNNKLIFECGGIFYDSIETYTLNAYSSSIQYKNPIFNPFINSIPQYLYKYVDNTDYKYVSSIAFSKHYNTGGSGNNFSPNLTTSNVVNLRNVYYSYDAEGNVVGTYVDLNSSFINSSYQSIKVYSISTSVVQDLLRFNIESVNTVDHSSEVSLNTSFSLINTTLVGLTGFFSIIIFPGVSLGTLILVPFAVSILLFIISLFKR